MEVVIDQWNQLQYKFTFFMMFCIKTEVTNNYIRLIYKVKAIKKYQLSNVVNFLKYQETRSQLNNCHRIATL